MIYWVHGAGAKLTRVEAGRKSRRLGVIEGWHNGFGEFDRCMGDNVLRD